MARLTESHSPAQSLIDPESAAALAARREGFLNKYGLSEMSICKTNVARFLRSAPRRSRALDARCEGGVVRFRAMDHAGLFGRDKVPVVLAGHPYGLHPAALEGMDLFVAAGFLYETVAAGSREWPFGSWYSPDTALVVVCHPCLSGWPVAGEPPRTPGDFDALAYLKTWRRENA